MILSRVDIANFRSLKEVSIAFGPRCRVLIGINESGKSNILKALALLDDDCAVKNDDLRDFSPHEATNQPAYVRFVFVLDKDERIECLEAVTQLLLAPSTSEPIVRQRKKTLTLEQFVDSRSEALYRVDLRTKKKYSTTWTRPESYTIVDGWFQPSESAPADAVLKLPDRTSQNLVAVAGIHHSFTDDVDKSYLSPLTIETLDEVVSKQLTSLVDNGKPDCLYWTYSDSQLLPGQVVLDAFAATPSTCEPLRQMFTLAGVHDISKSVADAKARPNGIRNLLNRVAAKATEHMRAVWKDYRGIKIELAPNGPHIDASIKDEHNLYNFDRRSDGFKRFISFLLLVSAKVRNKELVNTLYLHDEPDIGLHPSGARYLRDELTKISDNNYIVFSTHSIFMIDREVIRRHLIVRKTHEVTDVTEADGSNIADEEVLYNALGYSLFETLRRVNILFEGWRDKVLFRAAIQGSSARARKLKRAFSDVGLCHAKGVKDIGRITPMLELASRKWLIISDCDQPAVEHQRDYDGEGPWYRYNELCAGVTALSGEDFLKPEAFKAAILGVQKTHPGLAPFDMAQLSNGKPRVPVLREWLKNGGITGDALRRAMDQIKEGVFSRLKPTWIVDQYWDVCDAIRARIERL